MSEKQGKDNTPGKAVKHYKKFPRDNVEFYLGDWGFDGLWLDDFNLILSQELFLRELSEVVYKRGGKVYSKRYVHSQCEHTGLKI